MTYFVSAIIPVHNGERFLAEALESILAQNYAPLEIIIVDDGSTDGTGNVIAAAQAAHGATIRSLSQPQAGPSAARNRGIAHARGDVIAFLDHDDLWAPNFLRRHTAYLATHPEIDIVQGHIIRMQCVHTAVPDALVFEPTSRPYHFILLGSALYRANVFERVGGLDERLWQAEDTDWFMRAWEMNIPKVVLEDVVLYVRRHDTNRTRARGPHTLPLVFKRHLDRLRAAAANADALAPNPARTKPSEYLGLPPKP